MNAIRWVLIGVEFAIGVSLTVAGMANGLWITAKAAPYRDPSDAAKLSRSQIPWRRLAAYTAPGPIAATLLVGWLGPQPHGNPWFTMLAGVIGAAAGWHLALAGLAWRRFGVLTAIGMLLPAMSTTFVYNMEWLLRGP